MKFIQTQDKYNLSQIEMKRNGLNNGGLLNKRYTNLCNKDIDNPYDQLILLFLINRLNKITK